MRVKLIIGDYRRLNAIVLLSVIMALVLKSNRNMYENDGICYAGEMTPDIEVSSIKVLPDGILIVRFTTGEDRLFDVTTLLDKDSAYLPLSDEKNRKTAEVRHGFVCWMGGEIDIAPETLYSESYPY